MKHISSFKFFLFLILISTFLSQDQYSQGDRTIRNPNRNKMGDRNDRQGDNDKTTNQDEERKQHTGITIERPRRPDTDPITKPERHDPPVFNPPSTIQDPEPPVIEIEIVPDYPIEPVEPVRPVIGLSRPEPVYDPIKSGLAKLDEMDYFGALEDFNNAIEEDTSNYKLYYYRGFTFLQLKNYIESVKDFDIYLDYFFYDMEGFFQRGLAKFYLRKKLQALEDFRIAADMGHKAAASIIKRFY